MLNIFFPPRKVSPEHVDIIFPETGLIISQPSEAIAAWSDEKIRLACRM